MCRAAEGHSSSSSLLEFLAEVELLAGFLGSDASYPPQNGVYRMAVKAVRPPVPCLDCPQAMSALVLAGT